MGDAPFKWSIFSIWGEDMHAQLVGKNIIDKYFAISQ